MESFPNIKQLVETKDWKFLVKNTLPVNISDTYSFSEAMHIIDRLIDASVELMLEDGFTADLMRDYSVNLMIILRAKYSQDWKKDWKNEAYLGIACALVYREEEAFVYIQNAYQQLEDPPQSLILAYISAGSGPDHFLTKERINELSQKAIEKGVTHKSALRMAALAYEKKDFEKHKFWKDKASEAEIKGLHTPIIVPSILKNICQIQEGWNYEK